MDQKIINLYDAFTHGDISRRTFMNRLGKLAGSTAAAAALLPLLKNDYAKAAMIAEDDDRLAIETVTWDSGGTEYSGYLARLKGGEARPAVIVIHENRGLNPHIEDVTRRLAVEGFLAMAPDLLSPAGGTPDDEDRARDMIGELDADATVAALGRAVAFMAGHVESNVNVGAVGFCWGGGMVNQLAVARHDLDAAVAYYGRQPDAADVPRIEAPLLLHYAGLDERIGAGIEAYTKALDAAGKTYEMYMYEGVNHAFNNDTGQRYDKEAADLAWSRTIEFLNRELNPST